MMKTISEIQLSWPVSRSSRKRRDERLPPLAVAPWRVPRLKGPLLGLIECGEREGWPSTRLRPAAINVAARPFMLQPLSIYDYALWLWISCRRRCPCIESVADKLVSMQTPHMLFARMLSPNLRLRKPSLVSFTSFFEIVIISHSASLIKLMTAPLVLWKISVVAHSLK